MEILPKKLRFNLIRALVKVPTEISSAYVFKIAETKEEYEQAYKVLHDAYVQSGFMNPESSGMRILKHFLLPTTLTLVVKFNEKVIGTMSIIRRTRVGLPLEECFSLSKYIKNGEPCAEISSLAIDKNHLGDRGMVFFPFLKFLNIIMTDYLKIKKLFTVVNPSMADYYECLLLFKELHSINTKNYKFANGAAAVGFWCDFELAKRQGKIVYGTKPSLKNLYWYFFDFKYSNFIFPKKKYFTSVYSMMNFEMINYFFIEKSNILRTLNEEELKYILQLYSCETADKIWNTIYKIDHKFDYTLKNKNRKQRFLISNVGLIKLQSNNSQGKTYLLDISVDGLKLGLKAGMPKLHLNDLIEISFFVSKYQEIKVKGTVLWINQTEYTFGVKITKVDNDIWFDYIHYLHSNNSTHSNLLSDSTFEQEDHYFKDVGT